MVRLVSWNMAHRVVAWAALLGCRRRRQERPEELVPGTNEVSSITVTRARPISGKAILDFCSRTNEMAARLAEQAPHFMA
jgi:hypothetical protein